MTRPPPDDRYERLKALFLEALEVDTDSRPALLARACPEPSLRAEVGQLLSLHGRAADLLAAVEAEGEPPAADLPRELGPYRIRGLLGWGAMGVVYLADRTTPPGGAGPTGSVALKIFRAEGATLELRRRFEREAEILGRLDHPGIARLLDAGVLEHAGSPVPYVAMEHIEGLALRRHVETERPDTRARLAILAEIADALDCAHARGVVHRDLKPENLIVGSDGRPRILDFGVARLTEAEPDRSTLLTRVGQLVGTPQYMSPEQAQAGDRPVDGRTDIYSLGVIGYEILAGRPPYVASATSLHRAVVTILTAEPAPLSTVSGAFRGAVEDIIGRALEKKPDDRYARAADLARDIRAHLAGRTVAVPPSPARRAARERRRRRRARILLAALLAVALAAGVALTDRIRPGGLLGNRDPFTVLAPRLERASDLLHATRRDRNEILAAIATLRSSQEELARMPAPPYRRHLEKFIHWRLGEAHYFLGGLDEDPSAYQDALAAWDRAHAASLAARGLERLDRSRSVFAEIARLGRHHPRSGAALASRALAEYQAPAMNLDRAVQFLQEALAIHEESSPANYDPEHGPTAFERRDDRAMILNDLGEAVARSGSLREDLERIDEGLSFLARADTSWGGLVVRAPRASFLLHFAAAWRLRAELRRSPADLDSADARLAAAAKLRTAAESPSGFVRVQVERARVAALRARFARDPVARRRHLSRALGWLTLTEGVPSTARAGVAGAELSLLRAETLADLAAASGGAGGAAPNEAALLAESDSLVAAAAAVLTKEAQPIRYADLERVRGHVLGSRWRLFGEDADRRAAIASLRLARALVPDTEDRRHARLVNEGLAAIEADALAGNPAR